MKWKHLMRTGMMGLMVGLTACTNANAFMPNNNNNNMPNNLPPDLPKRNGEPVAPKILAIKTQATYEQAVLNQIDLIKKQHNFPFSAKDLNSGKYDVEGQKFLTGLNSLQVEPLKQILDLTTNYYENKNVQASFKNWAKSDQQAVQAMAKVLVNEHKVVIEIQRQKYSFELNIPPIISVLKEIAGTNPTSQVFNSNWFATQSSSEAWAKTWQTWQTYAKTTIK